MTGSGVQRTAVRENSDPDAVQADLWGGRFLLLAWLAAPAVLLLHFQAGLTVLAVAGYLALLCLPFHPALSLYGLSVLVTMDAVTREFLLTGGLLRWNTLNYLLILAAVVNSRVMLTQSDIHNRILAFFLTVLTAWLVLSSSLELGVQHVIGMAAALCLPVFILRGGRSDRIWVWMAMVNGTVSALVGIGFFAHQDSLPYINPNTLVLVFLTALFFICLGLPRARSRQGTMLLMLAAINLVLAILTASRGGIVVALLCAGYCAIHTSRSQKFAFGLCTVAVALPMVTLFASQEAYAMNRLARSFESNRSLSNKTSGRSDLALGAWYIFLENPLGVGTGGFAHAYSLLQAEGLAFAGKEKQAHSGWAKVLAENGIIGVLAMAAYIASFGIAGWSRKSRSLRLLGILTTLCLGTAFLSTEFQNKGLWFLAAAAGIRLRH